MTKSRHCHIAHVKKKIKKNKFKDKENLPEKLNLIRKIDKNENNDKKNYDLEPHLKTVEQFRFFVAKENSNLSKEYFFDEIINKGSYGLIIKGNSIKYKGNLAFKYLFNKEILDKEKWRKNIKNEISILHKLNNKNINHFYGFFEIHDSYVYILEYEKYGDLSNFLKILKRPIISETLIAYITVQIIMALRFCHSCKIAHLDLKKQNILVDENFNFKLCDFSVATQYNNNDIKLNKVGTSLYISPENLNKNLVENSQISKIDIYSMGILIYNLAFKSYPYNLSIEDSQDFILIESKIKGNKLKIPFNSQHSSYFRDFLEACLEKDIYKRISIEDVIIHPWYKMALITHEEKEKFSDIYKFLIILVTDNLSGFNQARQNIL